MTENEQEQAATDEAPKAPVRVPNVSPGAVSGLAHEVIGSAANDAYDAEFGAQDAPTEQGDSAPHPDNPEDQDGQQIEGTEVTSDTAGTGEAVNAETGEVTQPGEPLPPVEGQDEGTPLEPQEGTDGGTP